MKKLKWCFLVCGLVVVAACSPVRVTNKEATPGFQLSAYDTFAFYTPDSVRTAPAAYKEQIKLLQDQIRRELVKRGLTQTSSQPNLLVNIGVMVTEKTQTRETRFGQDAPYYIGQRRYSWKSKEVPVRTYREGTASVHLVDREKNELVWQAEAESVIPDETEKLQERIREGVAEMFEGIQ